MFHEGFEVDEFCYGGVCGLEDDFWSLAGLLGFLPAKEAEAPAVAWFETGELVFGARGGEVISLFFAKGEELFCHDGADGVHSLVLVVGLATAVTEEACHW